VKLSVSGIDFNYGSKEILNEVSLNVSPSEVFGILGPNGSGKTTLLRCINGILTPKQGHIALDETDTKSMTRQEIAKNMGYVPQNSLTDLCVPTVFEVVLMGRKPHAPWGFSEKDKEIAWLMMEELDVKHLAAQQFDRLSSGQTQRVLMARAMAQEAKVLLLDEPTSNLDVRYQIEIMNAILGLSRKKGVSACVIVHDLDLAMRFCDKLVLLDQGKIVAMGKTEDVLTPQNIKDVYGVDSIVSHDHGRPRVLIL